MERERLVKGGKSEGKITGPLFPRLHVDDKKKIGPRAPPRNKMALYEQLSMPSQWFSNTQPSTLPLPPVYGGRMLTSMSSSSQGVGIERGMISHGQKPHAPYHSNGRKILRYYERLSNNTKGNPLKRSIIAQSENMNGAESQLSEVPSTFLEPCNFSQFKWPYLQNDESELRCPTFVHSQMGLDSSKNKSGSKKDKIFVSASCSLELQTTSAKKVKTFMSPNLESAKHVTISNGDDIEVPEVRHVDDKALLSFPRGNEGHDKILNPISQARDIIFPKLCLKPLAKEEQSEMLDLKPVTSNFQNNDCKQSQTDTIKARSHLGKSRQLDKVCRGVTTEEPKATIVNNASILRSESCHEFPITNGHRRTLSVGSGSEHEENQFRSCPVNFDNVKEVRSHTSVKDCSSQGVITPYVVVEMIGHKHFWKARKEIIDQQRVFSMQVFELHRIMKGAKVNGKSFVKWIEYAIKYYDNLNHLTIQQVQKMLSGSGNLQLKEPLPLGNALVESNFMKELLPESKQDAPSWHETSRNEVSKIKVVDKLPLLPLSSDTTSLATNNGHNFGKHTNTNLSMLCLPPPGNQWLLPVMSPSEGLVYKPYPNLHHPPPGGFFPTLYGECGVTNTTTLGNEEFLNSPIGVRGGAAPMDPSYFAPYGMSIISPLASPSTIKQMTGLTAGFNSFYDVQSNSCISNGTRNVGEAKDSEKLESTASCPKKIKTSNDALQLFPTTPTTLDIRQPIQSCCSNERKTKVIKVIPRNPRLASESVASIIKSIQEERKTSL